MRFKPFTHASRTFSDRVQETSHENQAPEIKVPNADLLSRPRAFPELCRCVRCHATHPPLRPMTMTYSVTPEASGLSAWVSSTVYESTGFRFPDSQQISAASSQLRISLLFITGGEGARCGTKGGRNDHSAPIQPVCPEHGQPSTTTVCPQKTFDAVKRKAGARD